MSKSLLPLNATSGERALEQVTERASDLPVPIQTLWGPQTCPENLLPWLAWALSVDAWDSDWPTVVKRKVIAESVVIHRRKGTVEAVRRAMAVLGVQVELREWFEIDGPPHTFSVTAWAGDNFREDDAPLLTADYYRSLKRAVDTAKPVRSHYDFKVGARFYRAIGTVTTLGCTLALRREAAAVQEPIAVGTGVKSGATVLPISLKRCRIPVPSRGDLDPALPATAVTQRAVTLVRVLMEFP